MKRTRIGIFKGSNKQLRQDLEICRQLRIPLLALADSPIERISELESLSRKLVGVIDNLRRQLDECGLDGEMWEIYRKAKEVLGDD